jgi:mannose-1-phosphate guanylyltransferase / mannose-6-phosphate isomerase
MASSRVVVRGGTKATGGGEVHLVTENEPTSIPPGLKHWLRKPSRVPLEMIEVQSGAYLGEDDIARLADHHGRHSK